MRQRLLRASAVRAALRRCDMPAGARRRGTSSARRCCSPQVPPLLNRRSPAHEVARPEGAPSPQEQRSRRRRRWGTPRYRAPASRAPAGVCSPSLLLRRPHSRRAVVDRPPAHRAAALLVRRQPLLPPLLPSPRPDPTPTAQLGASRSFLLSDTAESVARRQGHGELAAWLAQSRHWTTPLHHLDSLSLARTRQRNGPSTGAAPIRCRARAACLPLGFSSAPAPRHAPRPRALRTRLRRSPWRGRARARRRRWCHFPLRWFPRTRDTLTFRGIYTRHSGTHRAWPRLTCLLSFSRVTRWSPPQSRGAPPRTACGPSGCSGSTVEVARPCAGTFHDLSRKFRLGSPSSCSRSATCWRGRLRRGESPPYRPRDPLVATLALLGGRGMAEPSTSPLTVNCMWGG